MTNRNTIPYILIGAGLLVCAALTASAIPGLIYIVRELPQDIVITGGLLSILLLTMFAMFIYALNSRI